MKQLTLLLLIISIGFVSCKQADKSAKKETAPEATQETAPDTAKDSAAIRNTIMEFYNWYNTNDKKLQAYNLYNGIKKKDSPPYQINWEEAEKYLTFIHTSVPQLGSAFINNQRLFFKQCDSAFKVDTEDDIPYGFDYDWFTNSQEEPQVLLDELNQSKQWLIIVKGDDAHVAVKGTYTDNGKQTETTVIKVDLKKEGGKWKIAKIGANQ